jgi:chitin disaccharide deacetylase
VRRLIINADDFGLTHGVNRAIAQAHSTGIVTSATLMAQASARDDAVRLASHCSNLSVGCHLVLVDGSPTHDPSALPTLVKSKRFRESLPAFAAAALSGRIDSAQVEAEATAQIRSLQQLGIPVTHFDTHKHTHIFPAILRPLLRAARNCGIRALRNPFGPRLPFSLEAIRRRPRLWKRFIEVRLLRAFSSTFTRVIRDSGMISPDGSFGVVSTGFLDLELFLAIIHLIPEGTWEFVCHPGYADSELATVRTRLRQSREEEFKVLTSPAASEALDRCGIQLISYRDLVAGH